MSWKNIWEWVSIESTKKNKTMLCICILGVVISVAKFSIERKIEWFDFLITLSLLGGVIDYTRRLWYTRKLQQ